MSRLTFTLFALALTACGASNSSPLPLRAHPPADPELMLVWVGRGEAEGLVDGEWQRTPSFDYHFTVVQRRFADRWESVKELHRTHPDYDGSAGPRDQTYYFRLDFEAATADRVPATVTSTLGNGEGESDRQYREGRLVLRPDVSSFAPFDTYRITQHYDYEEGSLRELVELLDHEDEREVPWVRAREEATLFAPHAFENPPTRF